MKLTLRLITAIALIAASYYLIVKFRQQVDAHPELSRAGGFSYRVLDGEFILTVELKSRAGSGPHGLQVEGGLLHVKTITDQHGYVVLQGHAGAPLAQVSQADVFQVERRQDTLIFSAAKHGDPLQVIASAPAPAGQNLRVGYYDGGTTVRNLRWTVPKWKGHVQYKDYLGSQLEVLHIETGVREIIYATRSPIGAPNWSADGKSIMFNSVGFIYQFDLARKDVSKIDTGTRQETNLSHIISFDGKWLGITNHTEGTENGTVIYKLPVTGGEPQALTLKYPAYLTGWSPDGKFITYSANRLGKINVYRTTTDGAATETQLTDSAGRNDGGEYAPDGKHIYFHSSRTGVMQIWRMDPDGANPRQLTFGSHHNWYPHVSPDNRQIVFLSYPPELKADDHPYYEQVTLRTMPVGGGAPRVVAYLYGGQGTFNVPSWSPDGKQVAFVSNTYFPAD